MKCISYRVLVLLACHVLTVGQRLNVTPHKEAGKLPTCQVCRQTTGYIYMYSIFHNMNTVSFWFVSSIFYSKFAVDTYPMYTDISFRINSLIMSNSNCNKTQKARPLYALYYFYRIKSFFVLLRCRAIHLRLHIMTRANTKDNGMTYVRCVHDTFAICLRRISLAIAVRILCDKLTTLTWLCIVKPSW